MTVVKIEAELACQKNSAGNQVLKNGVNNLVRIAGDPSQFRTELSHRCGFEPFVDLLFFKSAKGSGKAISPVTHLGPHCPLRPRCCFPARWFFDRIFLYRACQRCQNTNFLCYISYSVMIFLSDATIPREIFLKGVKLFSRFLPMTTRWN